MRKCKRHLHQSVLIALLVTSTQPFSASFPFPQGSVDLLNVNGADRVRMITCVQTGARVIACMQTGVRMIAVASDCMHANRCVSDCVSADKCACDCMHVNRCVSDCVSADN